MTNMSIFIVFVAVNQSQANFGGVGIGALRLSPAGDCLDRFGIYDTDIVSEPSVLPSFPPVIAIPCETRFTANISILMNRLDYPYWDQTISGLAFGLRDRVFYAVTPQLKVMSATT